MTGRQKIHPFIQLFFSWHRACSVRYLYSGISFTADTTILCFSPKLLFDSIPSTCDNVLPFQLKQASLVQNISVFYFSGKAYYKRCFDPVSRCGYFSMQYKYTTDNGCKIQPQKITVWPPHCKAGPGLFVLEGATFMQRNGYPSNFSGHRYF